MGIRYMELGMLDVAKEKLDLAADLDSGNSEILNAQAVFYERIKNYPEASERYKEALNKDPSNLSTKSNYGRLLCEQGSYEQGMHLLQEALDAPMNNRAWLSQTNMGLCLLKQNQEAKAEGFFRQALQGNGEYAPALQEMQKISYHNQQYMSARAFLERYLAVAKHCSETLWLAFQTERALGSSQTADDYKDQLLTLFPASKEALEIRSAISR
jgi:type IV pilus assembly protein PilF